MAKYIPTIGLEIHAELTTQTKMFCDSLNDPETKEPNVNVCPVCMGHPGTLPVVNKKAVEEVIRVGYALGCTIADVSKFDRKNYFYPDLPKGYQISQYDMPFCSEGNLELPGGKTNIRIERIHLEEDAGRLVHDKDGKYSLVDFNRAGVPLMELVTYPDLHSVKDTRLFAEELRRILRYLKASYANMEKGQMRIEVNLSMAKENQKELGTKVEMKNLNSFRIMEDAIAYEIDRQTKLLDEGKKVVQETRGWDESKKLTFSQRSKEEAHDYRYFPEPDLPSLRIDKEHGFDKKFLKDSLPELPRVKRDRLAKKYPLSEARIHLLLDDPQEVDNYEELMSEIGGHKEKQIATEYFFNELRALKGEEGAKDTKITSKQLGDFSTIVVKEGLSSTIARPLFRKMYETGDDPTELIKSDDFKQTEDEELKNAIREVLAEHAGPVADYKNGKKQALQFLVGQVMAKTKGKANPQVVGTLLEKELE